jgi:uncharacterized protein
MLYEQDALAARIVDRVVDDATMVEWRITGTDETYDWASIKSQMDDIRAVDKIGDAWRWGRLYGGGIIILACNDGRPYDQPLDMASVRSIKLSVLDSTSIQPVNFLPGLGSSAFAEPEQYQVMVPWGSNKQMTPKVIHKSRIIRFDGVRVPASRMVVNGGWGPSVIQRVFPQLRGLQSTMGYAESVLHEISVMVLKIKGFRDMLCGGPDEVTKLQTMLQNLRNGMDNQHIVGLDSEDEYQEVKRSVDGISNLIDKFVDSLVRSTNYPRLILLGEQPGGLNADSKGEVRAYYDWVGSEQKKMITPALNRILEVLFAVRRNKGIDSNTPTEWSIEFESLMAESNETKAQNAASVTDTMVKLISAEIITPQEARMMLIKAKAIDVEMSNAVALGTVPEPNNLEEDDAEQYSKDPLPSDALEAREIASQLGIPTVRVTRAHRSGAIRGWNLLGGRPRYSLQEVKDLILAENGETPSED